MERLLAGLAAAVVAGGVWLAAAGPAPAAAPEPTKPVDLARYLGRWYEIARTPNDFERGAGCQGPTADYSAEPNGRIRVVQTCHRGSPTGAETVYRAAGHIVDPGTNARLKLTYYLVISKEYWVLDYSRDYQWAIVGDPSGHFLWLLARAPDIPAETRAAMLQRVRALGYDAAGLEFPAQR